MILQRIEDWRRERRIRAIASLLKAAQAAHRRNLTRALFIDLQREVAARSPGQVKRMERSVGINIRSSR